MSLLVNQRLPRVGGETSKPKHVAGGVPFSKEQLRDIFKRFDCDKDGRLSKEELKKAFSELGSRVPAFRTLAALHHADENGDGFISEEELEALLQYALGLGYTIKME
ncbi:Calcium-binding EF-hand [Corchorus olitorius]|uniref:Calcium-binding EF-hand n=1 Tax=Corchorus olitorius TaxID=93759 RepID=A0A1R3KEU0_9ROSI|nr:Calcium-binding EF-hand [Corchorus olitorius]